jgi:2-methylisocitrate lyase-like PEP mutase family enzyme
MSGAYVNHSRGYPDGTLTLSEIAERAREIAQRVDIPLIADGDEGFGGILKVVRTILNVKLVIYGASMLSRAFAFMEREYAQWLAEGRFAANAQDEIDRVDALKRIGLLDKEALLRKYGE